MKNMLVTKANKIIEAGYKLSLNEQRLILYCIAQIHSKESLEMTDSFDVHARDFAKFAGIREDGAYLELQKVADHLFERYIVIENPDPEKPTLKYTKTRWISSIGYLPEEGTLYLSFAHKMLPYLSLLEREFTSYRLEYVGQMTSIYAIRLYELLIQWGSVGKREVELQWLKKQFQIEEEYSRIFDLKKCVLTPAINQINQYTDLEVSWTQRKRGRRVSHLIFNFKFKSKKKSRKKVKDITPMKEPMRYGVPMSRLDKEANPGESWQDAAFRIRQQDLKK